MVEARADHGDGAVDVGVRAETAEGLAEREAGGGVDGVEEDGGGEVDALWSLLLAEDLLELGDGLVDEGLVG